MGIYRVEKDGVTFYVQPEQMPAYQAAGYTIYKQVEQIVSDVKAEMEAADARQGGGVVEGEVTVNG